MSPSLFFDEDKLPKWMFHIIFLEKIRNFGKKKILFIFKVRESMCMSRGRGGGEERKRESDAVSLLSLEPQVGLSLKTARS